MYSKIYIWPIECELQINIHTYHLVRFIIWYTFEGGKAYGWERLRRNAYYVCEKNKEKHITYVCYKGMHHACCTNLLIKSF